MGLFRKKSKLTKSQAIDLLVSYLVGNSPVVFYNYDSEDFIKKGYSSNAEIYSIIKKITDKCNVSTPYVYIDREGVKSNRSMVAATRKQRNSVYGVARHNMSVRKALDYAPDDSDISKLLVNPNETQTWREFITLSRIFYFVQGEMFWWRHAGNDNCALSLHIAPAQRMQPILTNNKLSGWRMNKIGGGTRDFDLEDVFHFKMPNPNYDDNLSFLRGMSPLLAGLKYLQLSDKSLEAWIKSMQNEGAKGIVSPNHPNPELWLTPDQVTKTEDSVRTKIEGVENRNKIVVSGMPLQYTQIGLSPDALNIIKGLDQAGVKLCDLWGVPAVLFDPNPTYQNQKEAGKRFVLEVVLPYLNAEEDKINQWLVAPFVKRDGIKYTIDYDLSAYDELRLDLEDAEAMLKTHTINEVRVMLGSDELEEDYANQVFISQGMVPLSDYAIESTQI